MSIMVVRVKGGINYLVKGVVPRTLIRAHKHLLRPFPINGDISKLSIQKQSQPLSSLSGNNLTPEHKKLSNQTKSVMVHALQITRLMAIVGTLLHSNGDLPNKRRRLNGRHLRGS